MDYGFETEVIHFVQPAKKRRYTPDFIIKRADGSKLYIESKGRFMTADRQKHVMIKEQHPDLDIRFVFSNPNAPIRKGSKTTYAMWCKRHGFKYAKEYIPKEWLNET